MDCGINTASPKTSTGEPPQPEMRVSSNNPSQSSEPSHSPSPSLKLKPQSSTVTALDEDPNSELNLLRREVRQLQAAVRDAALETTSHEDEILRLRKALAAAEANVESGLAREADLQTQLNGQRVQKQHLETTLATAEALVSALREMALESTCDPLLDPGGSSGPRLADSGSYLTRSFSQPQLKYQPPATKFQSHGQPNLDLALSRIPNSSSSKHPSLSDGSSSHRNRSAAINRRHSTPIRPKINRSVREECVLPSSSGTSLSVNISSKQSRLLRSAFGTSVQESPLRPP